MDIYNIYFPHTTIDVWEVSDQVHKGNPYNVTHILVTYTSVFLEPTEKVHFRYIRSMKWFGTEGINILFWFWDIVF